MAETDHAASSVGAADSSSTAAAADVDDADDYREVWLRIWNNSTNPKKVSCVTAFDILYYCFSPANQLRALYRTGQSDLCQKAIDDVKLCARIKAGKLTTQEAREALRASRDSFIVNEPHVWEWRTEPPEQFRQVNTTTADTTEASHGTASTSGTAAHTSSQPSMR